MPKKTLAATQLCAIDGCTHPATVSIELYPATGRDRSTDETALSGVWPTWMCDEHGSAWQRNAR